MKCSSSLLRILIKFFLFHTQPPHRPYLQHLLSLGHCKRTVPAKDRLLFQIDFLPPRIPASSCSASFSRTGSLAICGPAISAQLPQKALPLFNFFLPVTHKTSCSTNQICSKTPTAGILFNKDGSCLFRVRFSSAET